MTEWNGKHNLQEKALMWSDSRIDDSILASYCCAGVHVKMSCVKSLTKFVVYCCIIHMVCTFVLLYHPFPDGGRMSSLSFTALVAGTWRCTLEHIAPRWMQVVALPCGMPNFWFCERMWSTAMCAVEVWLRMAGNSRNILKEILEKWYWGCYRHKREFRAVPRDIMKTTSQKEYNKDLLYKVAWRVINEDNAICQKKYGMMNFHLIILYLDKMR